MPLVTLIPLQDHLNPCVLGQDLLLLSVGELCAFEDWDELDDELFVGEHGDVGEAGIYALFVLLFHVM